MDNCHAEPGKNLPPGIAKVGLAGVANLVTAKRPWRNMIIIDLASRRRCAGYAMTGQGITTDENFHALDY
jgi:hypothetical protein